MAPIAPLVVAPIPGVLLRVDGDRAAIRHLAREYAGAATDGPAGSGAAAELDLRFVPSLPGARADRHKTARWAATLEWTAPHRLELCIALRSWPRWFGLSLVQGYLIEPALSLLAVQAGGVLLPAAAFVKDGSAQLLIGRSGTGKSSLSLRALAAGLPLLGDDQVFVSRDGTCTRFPRRLRFYDDAGRTAPAAISRLAWRYRLALLVRRAVRALSLGYVAPSLAVPVAALSTVDAPPSAPLGRLALLARRGDGSVLDVHSADVAQAVQRSAEALEDQRRRLGRILGGRWTEEMSTVADRERTLLEHAFASVEISAIDVPTKVGAVQAIDALAAELGVP